MKFEIMQGCTTYNFLVDGKKFSDLSQEEQSKIIDVALAKMKQEILNNHISFQGILEHFKYDEYDVGNKCETCGDTPVKFVINI